MPAKTTTRDLLTGQPNRLDAIAAQAIEQLAAQHQNPIFDQALDFMRPVLHDHLRRNLGPRSLPQINKALKGARMPQPEPERPRPAQPAPRAEALKVMGLKETATEAEISAAYRAIAPLYHPDKFSNKPAELQNFAEAKMRELNAAHEFLKGGKR